MMTKIDAVNKFIFEYNFNDFLNKFIDDFFPRNTFKCRTKYSFIPLNQVCNGIMNCKDGTDEFYCKEINCHNSNSCSCHKNFLTTNCKKSIDFENEIFFYTISLNLKKIIKIENDNLKNYKIIHLKITETQSKILINILKICQNIVHLNISGNFFRRI